MRFIKPFLVFATAACMASASLAQAAYPERPVRIVVPFPAGGGTDILTRLVATAVTTRLGWAIVIDNKPGAGGNLALDAVAKSRPDGYTLVMAQTDNIVMNPLLYDKLSYDPAKDFEPVAAVARGAGVVVVRADSPYKTLADVVAAAHANPGKLTFATPGTGTTPHIFEQLWETVSGIKFTHVPYRGAAQAVPDLFGGQVDIYMGSIPTMRAYIESGKVRALGVTALQRSPVLKDVPTFAEAGIPGVELASLWGVMAPAGTPPAIVAKWNAAINDVVAQPEVRSKILDTGAEIVRGNPKQLGDQYTADRNRLAPVIRKANIKLD